MLRILSLRVKRGNPGHQKPSARRHIFITWIIHSVQNDNKQQADVPLYFLFAPGLTFATTIPSP